MTVTLRLGGLLLFLALSGCVTWEPGPDPYVGNKPGTFNHLIELKRKGKGPEYYERVGQIRNHAVWLRENGYPNRATAIEQRLKEILED